MPDQIYEYVVLGEDSPSKLTAKIQEYATTGWYISEFSVGKSDYSNLYAVVMQRDINE